MEIVKLKDKGQVTIPAAIRQKLAASEGDLFAIDVVDGAIRLTPCEVAMSNISGPRKVAAVRQGTDISGWIGAGRGGFMTPGEAEDFIRREREKWAER